MHRIVAPLFLCCAVSLGTPLPAVAVVINWSPVGNPGNPADTADGDSGAAGIQNFGAVPYNYRIGTYDVTNGQYAEFLNTVDPTGANALGLWNSFMNGGLTGGIDHAPGSKYVSVGEHSENHPVNSVTWYDAIRFANWLNNGQGTGSTETGAYALLGGTPTPSNGNSIMRNAGASVFLPSENEWYKAAFFNPATNSYFQYPTSSNATPIPSSPTALANHANFNFAVGDNGEPTDVGAYTGTTSPSGAFDMGGNVFQWNEDLIGGSFRGLRGGSWEDVSSDLLSASRSSFDPMFGQQAYGFRLATITVPEPSTGVLAVIACAMLWWWRKWFT